MLSSLAGFTVGKQLTLPENNLQFFRFSEVKKVFSLSKKKLILLNHFPFLDPQRKI